ncbi:GNAT family N-acetyltransferase [Paenibacillus thiaminolyticus]|uniref:GNAT family N-acetyltransferase n=1 Tax=Paenibacillus thiaminolyticus TaxID=49283 RepID=UPI0021759F07|nr:GNAT family N-acetyltransferase [Paenibacillus thiaminolyticus]
MHNSVQNSLAFIQKIMEEYRQGQIAPWGIEHKGTGKLIGTGGFVYWNVTHSRAELAYAICRQYWNQGYRIETRCLVDNAGSARVMEKAGMAVEGILRKHIFVKGSHGS